MMDLFEMMMQMSGLANTEAGKKALENIKKQQNNAATQGTGGNSPYNPNR